MLTLFHAPRSRSSTIVQLLEELGVSDRVTVRQVTIPRQDGSGGRDPENPHPDGKVPYLVDDGVGIRERGAITLYLTDSFPETGLAPVVGDKTRGAYLSWLDWYGSVFEPVFVFKMMGMDQPILHTTFRSMDEAVAFIEDALADTPYLMGDSFTAADLLVSSPFSWLPDMTPDSPKIRAWIKRCEDRPSFAKMKTLDGID
ncbi:glutathione S-transferase family protein [Oceaniglobus trochenteri]|uniref:glutathione S-transferase family protein n=1 Tax=Oceaniglobus trochenteri TaxID=2763260 RepID=UPI001CFFADED|nr:glutathione S-transferase family protein [Oceaniglobus trochenteri]